MNTQPTASATIPALLLAVLLAGVVALAVLVSEWVLVGSGLTFAALWVWIRMDTGVWVQDFEKVEFKVGPDPRDSR